MYVLFCFVCRDFQIVGLFTVCRIRSEEYLRHRYFFHLLGTHCNTVPFPATRPAISPDHKALSKMEVVGLKTRKGLYELEGSTPGGANTARFRHPRNMVGGETTACRLVGRSGCELIYRNDDNAAINDADADDGFRFLRGLRVGGDAKELQYRHK